MLLISNSYPQTEFCGRYYSKKHYPAQHATDQLSQDIIANKKGEAFASERIAKRMAKDIQAKDWDFELIIPVPNYKSDNCCKAPLLARILSDNISIPNKNDVLERIKDFWDYSCDSDERRRVGQHFFSSFRNNYSFFNFE